MRYFRLLAIDNEDGARDTEVLERKSDHKGAPWWQGHGIFTYKDAAEKYVERLGELYD